MSACCICSDAAETTPRPEFAPWPVRQCQGCGLVFLDERADQLAFVSEAAAQLQSGAGKQVEYWSFPQMYRRHRAVFDGYFAERLQRLRAYCPPLHALLDVGCGFGFFMDYARAQGLQTAGLDIEAQSVSYARDRLALDVAQVSFEDFVSDGAYDAIVACDVLEHVDDPPAFLDKCRTLLNDGGVLYIQVPNVLGDTLPPGGSFNWPYHLWQFNPDTLARLLENSGYVVREWWTGVMGVIGVYEAGGPDEAAQALWTRAAAERRGNRLQMLAQPREA